MNFRTKLMKNFTNIIFNRGENKEENETGEEDYRKTNRKEVVNYRNKIL